jgi:hypothetical protein
MVEGGNRSEDNNEIGSIHSCTVFSAFLENFEKTFFVRLFFWTKLTSEPWPPTSSWAFSRLSSTTG